MDFKELKKLDIVGLEKEIATSKKELFNLRLSSMTGQVKDVSQFKKLKSRVAQCLTLINQRRDEKGFSTSK